MQVTQRAISQDTIAPKVFYGEIQPCDPNHAICKAHGETLCESQPIQPTIIIRLYIALFS